MTDPTSNQQGQWIVAPGDPTYVFQPGVVKPIKCGSQKAAALIVAAVNAYRPAVETPALQGLQSISFDVTPLPKVNLVMTFDTMANAQAARSQVTRLLGGAEETSADQKSPAGPSATNSVACESEHPVAGAVRHLQGCAVRQAECDCGAYTRWICPKCATANELDKASCHGCGREKPKPAHEDCPF